MSGPDATLGYQIYKTSARNAVWGIGRRRLSAASSSSATPGSGNVTVHGRIPGGQAVPGGTYTDIVNITLTFFE
jgi:spore coat protein U-like protein